MMETGDRQGSTKGTAPAGSTVTFSESHADLLDLFGRWEALADANSDPRVASAPMPAGSGAARLR
ncbi:hypothetical protein [Massilia sp. YMA4]|uniref:hypothetical protein n=1 Tax=Massilia sp. YMA4 TaxID=1593482 RepID=UPI000DD10DCC|nr:hypothetical protein [Massilia sp. YMA4]AXA90636.1 hypothetical protein DPH57_05260 [Massilia sp. YMA4]